MHPVKEKQNCVITLGYNKPYPAKEWFRRKGLIWHRGIDFAMTTKDASRYLISPVDGWISYSSNDPGWGNYCMILFMDKSAGKVIMLILAHMQVCSVNTGQKINKGTTVGIMGSSGYSTAEHTHFEARLLKERGIWKNIDPKIFLT